MRSPLPSLIDLEAFEAAARHGSFVAAAGELHLTASAVSHRVKSLERQLGVVLFTRHARRIELTDHGRSYMPAVRLAFDELAVSTAGLFGFVRPSRRLTVRLPISYAVECVAPHLHRFKTDQPDIEVRLVTAIWADALAPDDVDVDIRFGTGVFPGHEADLLHHESSVAVWSAAFEAVHGPVNTPADLAGRPRVHVLGLDDLWPTVVGAAGAPLQGTDVTVDTSLAALEIAASGPFCAMVPARFAARRLAEGTLRTRAGCSVPMTQAHYVVRAQTQTQTSIEGLLFLEWLRDTVID